ncbi:MAG: gliding motility-associated C-terminal domain-containing protein [Bacteroidota bacterium]
MFFKSIISTFCFLSLVSTSVLAQGEANVWYFGQGQGIDFNNGFTIVQSNIQTIEGCANICDANGNILLYTNGGGRATPNYLQKGIIWDKDGNEIFDMQDDGGGQSANQSALFVPKPDADGIYYLFTMEEFESYSLFNQGEGLSYYEIDVNNSSGEVINYEEAIVENTNEALAGIAHANGNDFWIAVVNLTTNEINIFLVDALGVTLTSTFALPLPVLLSGTQIKFSPNGKWLGSGGLLYPFDNQTGTLSSPIPLPRVVAEFSPNGRYLFAVDTISFLSGFSIYQFDLEANEISSSEVLIENFDYGGTDNIGFAGGFQVASDGNIYFLELYGNPSQPSVFFNDLSKIQCPNSGSPRVERGIFNYNSVLPNGNFVINFPEYLSHYFLDTTSIESLQFNIEPSAPAICEGESIILSTNFSNNENYIWSTGETTPNIAISEAGIYTVTISDECCIAGEAAIEIFNAPDITEFEIEGIDDIECGEILTLNVVTNANLIEWSTGDTTSQVTISSPGTYTLELENNCESITEIIEIPASPNSETIVDLPNAFTPDGDGVNDTFGIISDCLNFTNYNLKIFDRWGTLVYDTSNFEIPWDGTYDGKAAPSDVYVFIVRYQSNNGITNTKSGDVTLIR